MTIAAALELLESTIADLGLETAGPLTLEADLRGDLGIDSVDLLDLLFAVNERAGLALTLEQLREHPEATRVETLVHCIRTAVAARAASGGEPAA